MERGRRMQRKRGFDPGGGGILGQSQKTHKLQEIEVEEIESDQEMEKNAEESCSRSGFQLWTEKYAPDSLEDCCVNGKKKKQVLEWMTQAAALKSLSSRSGSRIAIFEGPAGSGKSLLLKLVCKKLGLHYLAWNLPVHYSLLDATSSLREEESLVNKFCGFLKQADRYKSLELYKRKNFQSVRQKTKPSVVVIDDSTIPNWTYAENAKAAIQSALSHVQNQSKNIVVFLITSDYENSGSHFSSFFQNLRGVPHFYFNPISKTSLSKIIKQISKAERFALSRIQTESLLEECNGDARALITRLQFLVSTKYADTTRETFKSKDSISYQSDVRDERLSIFHACGRILYRKTDNPEEILKLTDAESLDLTDYLFENYLQFSENMQIESICSISESFSDADLYDRGNWSIRKANSGDVHVDSACFRFSIASRGWIHSSQSPFENSEAEKKWRPLVSPHAYNISDELKRIRSKISLGKLRFQNLWCLQFSSLPIIFELLIPYMIILHSGNLSRHHWTSLSESDIEMSQFLETLKETSLISSDFFPTFSGEKLSSSADNASLNLSQAAPLRSEMDEFLVFFDDEISEDPIEEFSDSD